MGKAIVGLAFKMLFLSYTNKLSKDVFKQSCSPRPKSRLPKNFFRSFGPLFGPKIRGGGGGTEPPGPPLGIRHCAGTAVNLTFSMLTMYSTNSV